MANQQMISANASSSNFTSSSSAEPPKRYDVFLSFRGEDTRIGFTSYLYYALKEKQVETYIDNRLERGDEISSALMKAIEESYVSIIIFSENYASSKWCLEELSKVMECKKDQGQVVIPVFYRIDPSHVRKQSGSYEQAFANHVGDMRVHKWKVALTEAANLAGWHIQPDRSELEFVKDIAEDVWEKLNLRYPNELEGLFGIAERLRVIESLLKIGSNEVRIIGIWGMGGIGKTTLASALYIKLSSLFEDHCFLRSIGEESKTNGSNALGTLLFKLLGEENLKLIKAPELVPHFVKTRLRRKKVFVVLDDVTTLQQFRDLIINHSWLGLGSKVIVTSRYKHALSQADEVYEVKQLNHHNSIQLFCAHAFSEKHPKDGYEELLEGVIAYCKGIPLALQVLGAHMHGKNKEVCKDELKKLQRIPNMKIQEVLKLSYDSLDRTQKAIFLDIAFFLNGEQKDHVTAILEACDLFATSGIQHLIEKALITVSNGNAIEMHDLIRQMAWEIVHEESTNNPGKRSRLCNPEEVCEVLEDNTGTDAIEGISLDVSKIKSLHLNSDSFTKMIYLRYLHFYGGSFIDVCDMRDLAFGPWSFSRRLRSLRWQGYCLKSLPSTFNAKMLVELDMRASNLEKLWDGTQCVDNLKRIDLSGSTDLVEVPDLSAAPNLDEIYLMGCARLREVHPSILSLPKLRVLILSYCRQVESLRTNFHSTSLEKLQLEGCSSLKEFSVTSEALEHLELRNIAIHELPSSFWRNRNLWGLILDECGNLNFSVGGKNLVDGGMGSLDYLLLAGLKQLNASDLGIILGGAPSLRKLYLSGCCNIRALPDNIKNLSKLKELGIFKCMELEFVPELPPSLRGLTASDCKSLKTVSNFNTDAIWLRLLHILNCCNLEKLPDSIKNFSGLASLKLDDCWKLEGLPELPPSLTVLSAINCTSLDLKLTQRRLAELVKQHMLYSPKHLLEYSYILVPGDHVPDWFIRTTGTSITIPHLRLSHLCGFVCCQILPSSKFITYEVCCRITQDGSSEVLFREVHGIWENNFILDHLMIWFVDIRGDHHKIQKNGVNDLCNNISLEFEHFASSRDDDEDVTMKQMKGCGVFPFYASDLELWESESESESESDSEWELSDSTEDIVGLEFSALFSHMQELLPDLNSLPGYARELLIKLRQSSGVTKDIL